MFSSFFEIPTTLDFSFGSYLLYIVAITLIITCIRLTFEKNLLSTVILMSVFSLLITLCYLLMDAPDVAMTEAALGGCLSTCILLNFVKSLKTSANSIKINKVVPATIICLSFIVVISWVVLDLPEYGEQNTALHNHVSKYYITNTKHEIGIPSLATAVLASYRGYDTLGETTVILIAGLAVLLILSATSNEKKSL